MYASGSSCFGTDLPDESLEYTCSRHSHTCSVRHITDCGWGERRREGKGRKGKGTRRASGDVCECFCAYLVACRRDEVLDLLTFELFCALSAVDVCNPVITPPILEHFRVLKVENLPVCAVHVIIGHDPCPKRVFSFNFFSVCTEPALGNIRCLA